MVKRLEDYNDGDTIEVEEFYRLIGEEPPPSEPSRAPRKHEERSFQHKVQELAKACNWQDWHVLRSKGMRAGFPDLVLMRPPQLIWVELKAKKGKVTPAQAQMHEDLRASGQSVYLWYDTDEVWDEIEEVLR